MRGEGKTKTRKRPTGGTGRKIFTEYIEDDAHCYLPMQVTSYKIIQSNVSMLIVTADTITDEVNEQAAREDPLPVRHTPRLTV